MAKILLIDNGTTLLEKLKTLIPGNEIVNHFDDLEDIDTKVFDLVILSGGSDIEIVGNESRFEREVEIIKNSGKPVIGICFGCELIVAAFGGKLKKAEEKHKGIIDIEFVSANKTVRVYENHQWQIGEMPVGFEVLAKSAHGPEMIRHLNKLVYGLQFHPENFVEKTQGDEVFLEIFNKLLAAK